MAPPKNVIPFRASPTPKAKAPGPHGPAPNGTGGKVIDLHDAQVRELALDLLSLALDLAGIVDPTPVSDGANALIALGRGNWLDAAISGASIIPYVGDLAKAGKLPKYMKTVERAVALAKQSEKFAQALLPAFHKIKVALEFLPKGANPHLDRLRALVESFLKGRGAAAIAKRLPDVSKRFKFSILVVNGKEHKVAEGWLGVPGRVLTHRSVHAQKGVSTGSGDDAGHLIGNQFGSPGDQRNLSLQNWIMNRGQGTWFDLEKQWADLLQKGNKVRVKVTDVADPGKRPYHRKAEWTVVQPDGRTTTNHTMDFMNTTSEKSRAATGEVNKFPAGHKADVIPIDRNKK
jgi:DNA/RNA non-specific endonuclease